MNHIPGDPKGIEIVPDSLFRKCRCSSIMGSLKIKMPDKTEKAGSLEGVHAAFWICGECKVESPCMVKIDLRREQNN